METSFHHCFVVTGVVPVVVIHLEERPVLVVAVLMDGKGEVGTADIDLYDAPVGVDAWDRVEA